MKKRAFILSIAVIILIAIIALAKTMLKPDDVYLTGQTMPDGTTRYEGSDGFIAIVEDWHPSE